MTINHKRRKLLKKLIRLDRPVYFQHLINLLLKELPHAESSSQTEVQQEKGQRFDTDGYKIIGTTSFPKGLPAGERKLNVVFQEDIGETISEEG